MSGEVETCRVLDTILDFIVYMSVEQNFVTVPGVPNLPVGPQCKVRRLSLQYNTKEDSMDFCHVRSISVFGRSMGIPDVMKSRFLRVLDLEGCYLLSCHHLESIARELIQTQVPELQKHKFMSPEGIGNMQALEELKIINLYEQSSRFWLEISLLSNLRDLSILWNPISHLRKRKRDPGLSDVYSFDQPTWNNVVSSICKLGTCNLRSLSIHNHGYQDVCFKSWHPVPHCLQKLAITGDFIKHVPGWVGSLANIQKLELHVEEVRQDDVQIIGSLPALLYLSICIGPKGRVQLEVISTHGFTCLGHLRIGGSDECVLGLMFEPGSMPKLEVLVLVFDAIETSRLCNLDFAFGIEHLPCLTSIRCDIHSLGEILPPSKAVMVAMDRVVRTHPNHLKQTINILG
ncbi:hypothetical protein BAE44_0001413 [Dichanthelium oligosanthes]|uniref:Disease resistance R13L4/SHOC-2-like LRR domain-containing protein n=1 Tax=Dichanthelium oligosanthes TaxID=888268 RepID=A0A1E5WJN8_9POAL|nr:hypothetical protein BAE44_0001413 [Dichanthelium oligosanthes]